MALTDAPPPQLTIEVDVKDFASMLVEDEKKGAHLSIPFKMKIGIGELLQALTDLAKAQSIAEEKKPDVPQPKDRVEEATPATLAPAMPLAPLPDAALAPTSGPQVPPEVTWETPLDVPERAREQNRWFAHEAKWTLLDLSSLQNLAVTRIKVEPLEAKKPTPTTSYNLEQAEQALKDALIRLSDSPPNKKKGVASSIPAPPKAPPPKPAPSKAAPPPEPGASLEVGAPTGEPPSKASGRTEDQCKQQ